jgi:predicted secreted protein
MGATIYLPHNKNLSTSHQVKFLLFIAINSITDFMWGLAGSTSDQLPSRQFKPFYFMLNIE